MSWKIKISLFLTIIIGLLLFMFREEFIEGIFFESTDTVIIESDDIEIFVASDIHYLSSKINDNGSAFQEYMRKGDGKQVNYIREIFEAFTYEIKTQKPNLLIISGDLTNNGEKESHIDLAQRLKEIEDNGTEVFVIPGNHDILNPWAKGFSGEVEVDTETIDAMDFQEIYNDFGYKQAISKDRDTLSYLVQATEKLWFLMLDTNLYEGNIKNKAPDEYGEITRETYEWIDASAKLAKDNNAKLITVMHHNVIDHNNSYNKGFTLVNNEKAIKEFNDLDIDLVLSGHIHIQDIAKTVNSDGKELYDIATGSLSVYPQKYGKIMYKSENNILNYTTEEVNVDEWAKNTNKNDEILLNFKSYSQGFFRNRSRDFAISNIENFDSFTDIEKAEMLDVIDLLNSRVFKGEDNSSMEDITLTVGYKLIEKNSNNFYKEYINNALKDTNILDNALEIKIQ